MSPMALNPARPLLLAIGVAFLCMVSCGRFSGGPMSPTSPARPLRVVALLRAGVAWGGRPTGLGGPQAKPAVLNAVSLRLPDGAWCGRLTSQVGPR
jgi:hypothetical protein